MKEHFSETDPPEFVEYLGCKYRLKKAAMPAKQAEQKIGQIERSMSRLSNNGYPIDLPPRMRKEWTIDPNDLLKSLDTQDSHPLLIMWNPLTSDLLMASDADVNAPLHVFLHKRFKNDFTDYPDAGYDDWIRGVYDDSKNEVSIYKWGPLLKYIPFMGPSEKRYAERLQSEGIQAFKRMLEMHGAGSYSVRMKSANRCI